MNKTHFREDLLKIMLYAKSKGWLKPEWQSLTDEQLREKWYKALDEWDKKNTAKSIEKE